MKSGLDDLQQEWLGPEISITELASTGDESFRDTGEEFRGVLLGRLEWLDLRLTHILGRMRRIMAEIGEGEKSAEDEETFNDAETFGDDESFSRDRTMEDESSETLGGDGSGKLL